MDFKFLKGCNYNNLKEKIGLILEELNFSSSEVFIKPNFSGRVPIIPGENTDPKFLEILLEVVLNKGAKRVMVGHGSLLGTPYKKFPLKKIIEKGGYNYLKNKERIKLVDLDKEERKKIECDDFNFSIPTIIEQSDFYINLAKVKTHMETTVSLSLKNQMGLLPPVERIGMHQNNLERLISLLGKAINPDLNIIDGIKAMEGNGPHHGRTKELGIIVAGNDMVKLDSIVSFYIGFDFRKVKHISQAEELEVGKYPSEEELKKISDLGTEELIKAKKCYKFGKNIYVWPTTACSRCITALNESGRIIKKRPIANRRFIQKALFGKEKINIVIGRADDLDLPKDEKCITIGRCTERFSKRRNIENLKMCPPTIKKTLEHIKKKIEEND